MARRADPRGADAAAIEDALDALDGRARALVLALATFPLAGTPFLAALDGASAARDPSWVLRALAGGGLVSALTLPNPAGRSRAAWFLRDRGVAVAAAWLGLPPAELARERRLRRADLRRALEGWPFTSALYDAALRLIAAAPANATIAGWARDLATPGAGVGPPTSLAGSRRARRLPAVLTLAWRGPDGQRRTLARVLIPDIPHFPPARWAATLAGVRRLAGVNPSPGAAGTVPGGAAGPAALPPILIAAADRERAAGWVELCERVALGVSGAWPGGEPEIVLPDGRCWADGGPVEWRPAATAAAPRRIAAWAFSTRPILPEAVDGPRLVGDGPVARGQLPLAARLGAAHWQLLHDVAVLPYMPGEALRRLRGWSPQQFERLRAVLTGRGLVRFVTRADAPGAAPGELHQGLLEATFAGLTVLATGGGLDLATLARDRSYVGGDPARPIGARRLLLRQIRHTVAVGSWLTALLGGFAALRGADPATPRALRWSGPVASAVGHFWPDGYLTFGEGEGERHCFVEIDRGTEDRADFARKFAGYRALAGIPGFVARHDGTLPPLLLVAASAGDAARIAGYGRDEATGQPWAIPLWLATAADVASAPLGPFSPVWCDAAGGRTAVPLPAVTGIAPAADAPGEHMVKAASNPLAPLGRPGHDRHSAVGGEAVPPHAVRRAVDP